MTNTALEQAILAEFSDSEMQRHLSRICSYDRLSGSEGEAAAIDYVVSVLKEWGLAVTVHEFDAYVSNPVYGAIKVLGVEGNDIPAKTRAFSGTTPDEGVEGELVYVPGGKNMFTDLETAKRIEALDLHGKIVVSEGGGRSNMIAAQAKGAVGYIHMWPSEEPYLHEGTVSPVWGVPTPDTITMLPRIPVVQIMHADGVKLRKLAARGSVMMRITAKTETGWRRLRLPVTEIKGQSDEFVLVAGHIDSWHLGVTDNGTGNVACMEIARVMKKFQPYLKRSIRIAWWPGHSNARYSGSAWYADNFWLDLHDNCVSYINIDSPGALNATDYSLITAVAENASLLSGVVTELTGQVPAWERPVRAGDQSFWGTGVSSAYMLLSQRPPDQRAAVGGCGMGWWWHTTEDTMDKADPKVLLMDTKIYALTALRLAMAEVIPFDLVGLASELEREISAISTQVEAHLDLTSVATALADLLAVSKRFDDEKFDTRNPDVINRKQLGAIRILTEINYTVGSKFHHDAAVPAKPVPGIQPALELCHLDPDSDAYKFLAAKLVRERNRLQFALREATNVLR